jgi:hypothetical protein
MLEEGGGVRSSWWLLLGLPLRGRDFRGLLDAHSWGGGLTGVCVKCRVKEGT